MNIKHHTLFDTEKAIEIYSEKDGVPITYVCTTGNKHDTSAKDIFYRETPHPQFGNRYFGLFFNPYQNFDVPDRVFITDADWVEDLEFDMIEAEGYWHYSSHRHDFVQTPVGFIDGGREYTRLGGNPVPKATTFVVRDGQFVEKPE